MIAQQIKAIENEIVSIKETKGITYPIRLMAVSKTYPAERILEAAQCGQVLFGENRVLEAKEKFTSDLLKESELELHIIGHLQRNKAKQAVEVAAMIQSIDKCSTLDVIEKHCLQLDKTIDYLIEVNTSNEPQKHGIAPDKLDTLLGEINQKGYTRVNLRGLMTVGPLTGDKELIRRAFRTLAGLFNNLKKRLNKSDFDCLSMGMSSDYQIAIEEGSTLVRIGSKIFGTRNYG